MAGARIGSILFFVASIVCIGAAVMPLPKGGSVNMGFLAMGVSSLAISIALKKSARGGNAPPA